MGRGFTHGLRAPRFMDVDPCAGAAPPGSEFEASRTRDRLKAMLRWMVTWVGLAICVHVARADTLDIASYSPPQGWQRMADTGSVSYSTVDPAHRTFTIMVLFASVASTGDATQDFNAAWAELVAGPSRVAAPSQGPAPARTQQGMPMLVGAAQTMEQNVPAATLVAVIVARGRVVRFIAKTNDQSQLATLDTFVRGIVVGGGAAVAPAAPAARSAPGSVPAPPAGNASDVTFDVPAGWTRNGQTLVSPTGACTLTVFAPQRSGKSIEDDVDAAFSQAFAGWNRANDTGGGYEKLAKGVSADGWEYFKADSFLSRPANSGPDAFAKIEIFAFAFAARLDGTTAIVIGTRKDSSAIMTTAAIASNTPLCLDEYLSPDWPDFFHSFQVRSWKARPGELARHVVGKWWSASQSGAVGYAFAANGRYTSVAGWETFRRIDAATIETTTTGFTGTGKYRLDGDTLVMTPDKGKPQVRRVRWQNTFELGQWHETLYMQERNADGSKTEPAFRREK